MERSTLQAAVHPEFLLQVADAILRGAKDVPLYGAVCSEVTGDVHHIHTLIQLASDNIQDRLQQCKFAYSPGISLTVDRLYPHAGAIIIADTSIADPATLQFFNEVKFL